MRTKALSRHTCTVRWFEPPLRCQRGGGPELWNSHGESAFGKSFCQPSMRSCTNDHDSSIRTPIGIGARAPNQPFGLACADQRHPLFFCKGAVFLIGVRGTTCVSPAIAFQHSRILGVVSIKTKKEAEALASASRTPSVILPDLSSRFRSTAPAPSPTPAPRPPTSAAPHSHRRSA